MQKHDKVPATKVPATSGQVGEIAGVLIGEMKFSKDEATAIIGSMGAFRKGVHQFYSRYRIATVVAMSDLIRWELVYEKLFGLRQKPNFSGIRIPERPVDVGPIRLIVVASEILGWTPLQGLQETLKEHFPCWQYTQNLDESITTNDRHPKNGSYAIWVKDVREADAVEDHTGITVLERQLLEADYFFETGLHLDQRCTTLCTGSRDACYGNMPLAYWYADFRINEYVATNRNPNLRSRRVWT